MEEEYDLVVYDNEFEAMGEEYIKRAERFNEILEIYTASIKRILDEGIKSGQVHDNLNSFYETVEGLKDNVDDISKNAKKCLDGFIQDMDTADSYLY